MSEPDTNWMSPQEKWAWEKIKAGEIARLSEFPAHEYKDIFEDWEKPPVTAPQVKDDEGILQPIPEDDWPSWQILTDEFIEAMAAEGVFTKARKRNRCWIEQARVKTAIDLARAIIPGNLVLDLCRFDAGPNLQRAEISGLLSFQQSHFLQGFKADSLTVTGDVFLRNGARFEGEVCLLGAQTGGSLDCNGSHFTAGASGKALNADSLTVTGPVFLRNGARFEGEVCLLGAQTGGSLECDGSHFTAGASGKALNADGLTVTGPVFLRDGARFEGTLSFVRATLEAAIQLWGSDFDGNIDFDGASIGGELRLDETKRGCPKPRWGKGAEINLQNAQVKTLQSSVTAWRWNDVDTSGFIPFHLDGFSVERVKGGQGGDSLDTAESKALIAWLEAGTPTDMESERGFSHQAYLTLAGALDRAGREEKARCVRIALEQRKTREIPKTLRTLIRRSLRNILNGVNAYGFRPWQGFYWIAGVWLAFAYIGFAWSQGFQLGGFAQPSVWPDHLYQFWTWLGFSFEQIIPFVDLDPVDDNFLQNQFGIPTNEYGYAPLQIENAKLPLGIRALFMLERVIGVAILGLSLAGITAWAERRNGRGD